MTGLFFHERAPRDYRDWVNTDYEFYDSLAPELHELGILVEPDSREPWFVCEAHDMKCLDETLDKFERAVDITLKKLPADTSRLHTA
jgi:glutamate-1-semialdehyde 2,1-aminomutase